MTYWEETTVHPVIFGGISYLKVNGRHLLPEDRTRLLVALTGEVSITMHNETSSTTILNRPDRAFTVTKPAPVVVEGQHSDLLCVDSRPPVEMTMPLEPRFIGWHHEESLRSPEHLPFRIRRMYSLSGVPSHVKRGGHAHRSLTSLIFAFRGQFRVYLDNGRDRMEFDLNEDQGGLFIPNMFWREVDRFTNDAVLVAVSSGVYSESEMIRNYDEFKKLTAR